MSDPTIIMPAKQNGCHNCTWSVSIFVNPVRKERSCTNPEVGFPTWDRRVDSSDICCKFCRRTKKKRDTQ